MKASSIFFALLLSLSFSYGALAQEDPASEKAVTEKVETEEEKAVRLAAEEESKRLTEEGKQLMKDQDAEGAIELFKTAIEMDMNNIMAHRNLGIAHSWIGDQESAISAFKELIEVAPDYADGYRHLVLICNMQGLYEEAIEYGKKALELNDKDFAVMGYLAYDYVAAGSFYKSADLCRKLIEHNPNSNRAHRILAMSYLGMDMRDDALKAYKKSYQIVRKQSANKSAPEKSQSLKALFKKLEAEALFLSGNRYIENGDQISSINSYNRSIALNPDDFRPYYNLTKIYEKLSEKDIAIENLKKAVALNPGMLKQIVDSDEFDLLKDMDAFKEMLPKEEPAEGETE